MGEALVDFQTELKALTRRGIVLGIVSKNTEETALEAIEKHQREYAEASKIDFVRHSRELARLREKAVDNGQMGPAVNAEYRRGQLAGFYVDRREVVTASLDNMSRPELEAKLKEIRDHNIINGEAIGVEVKELEHQSEDEGDSLDTQVKK